MSPGRPNCSFYKRVTDDRDFAKFFLDWLFEWFRKGAEGGAAGEPAS